MSGYAMVMIVQVLILLAFAVIIGLVIYYKSQYDERRAYRSIRKNSDGDKGFSAFVNARDEGVDGDPERVNEIEY
jgi:uncharacterized protein YxeA